MRAPRPRIPRHTARLRLTVLFGGLFLICAAAVLGCTYLLVANTKHVPSSGARTTGSPRLWESGQHAKAPTPGARPQTVVGNTVMSQQKAAADQQATADREDLLIGSGIALGIVSVASFGLAWLAAGRILRPLATITATARRISATSLHERLGLPGPDDELKELGDTLDGLFDRLEASFQSQRHFVASASHELRTPLTAERALLQVALEEPAATADMWRAVGEELLASNTEQERLIEALLALATSQAGLHHREPVDLAAVTDSVLLAPRPEIARLDLHVEAITKPAVLDGDPLLAERLVANLLDNAVRHNIRHGRVRVTTRTSDNDTAILSVANTGPVIPAGTVDRLFQPFQRLRTRHAGDGHGYGLGLSIVQAIAAAHGATVAAQAQPHGGLTVDVTFLPPERSG